MIPFDSPKTVVFLLQKCLEPLQNACVPLKLTPTFAILQGSRATLNCLLMLKHFKVGSNHCNVAKVKGYSSKWLWTLATLQG